MKFHKKGCLGFLGILIILVLILLSMNINTLGLRLLTTYKNWTANQVDLAEIKSVSTASNHDIFNELLNQNVTKNGNVNYQGFSENFDLFRSYLKRLTDNPPDKNSWTEAAQLAYWINAYNAFTIDLILQHQPVKSIKDIGGSLTMVNSAWDIKFFKIGGVDFDLNTIEHDILRKQFNEPRIHFAINCASVSCPKLLNEAYVPERLDAQLQEVSVGFVNNTAKNIISEKAVRISPIFNWFEPDFIKKGTIVEFLNQYSSIKIEADAEVEFMDYEWGLNGD
ncbi:MAG: hypothetical protein ACI9XO_003838 [Paraglaciecola sp.]|jgi:hypothetical protein